MRKPIWAAVLGAFRQEFELLTTLSYLVDLQSKGNLDGIVISTWYGEVDRVKGLREKLKNLGIALVESKPLLCESPYANLNYLRQSTQMKAALALLPHDALVLKSRTDFSNYDFNRIEMLRKTIVLPKPGSFGTFSAGFSNRFSVMRYGVTCPFTFHDVTYLGAWEDVRRLCTTDNSMLSVGIDVWPDVWLFAPYFINRYPILEDFYRYIDHMKYMTLMMEMNRDREFFLPDALNKFYALYFVILYQCFSIFHQEPFPEEDPLSLEDVFYGREGQYLRRTWLVEIRNDEIVRRLVCGCLTPSEAYEALLCEIEKIKESGYAETLCITPEDYEELQIWGREYLSAEPDEWLRPYRKAETPKTGSLGFEETAKLLFSEYAPDEETINVISSIAHNDRSYYGEIVHHLDFFKNKNEELYKKALFNAARYADEEVIERIAELLYEDVLSEEEKTEALYPFIRYGSEDRLYQFPLTEKRINGLLKYCMYEERENETTTVRENWYRGIVGFYQPEGFTKEPEEDVTVELLRDLLAKIEPDG